MIDWATTAPILTLALLRPSSLVAVPLPNYGQRKLSTAFNAVCQPDARKTQEKSSEVAA
jgi:hypothetical protein